MPCDNALSPEIIELVPNFSERLESDYCLNPRINFWCFLLKWPHDSSKT
jgi:hypothetical protein